jgi:hypothetical protein
MVQPAHRHTYSDDALFDVADAAELLGYSPKTIYTAHRQGYLPGAKSRPRPTDRLKLRFRLADLARAPP